MAPVYRRGDVNEHRQAPRSRLPVGCVVHALAVVVLAAELIGTAAALVESQSDGAHRGRTPVELTCCAMLRSVWSAPDLVRLIRRRIELGAQRFGPTS
jgi:hypothetical protein